MLSQTRGPRVPAETPIGHVTPSALLHGAGPDAGFPADLPFAENAGAAAGKGVDEHAEFAKIEWIDPATPEGDRERKILGKWFCGLSSVSARRKEIGSI